MRDSPASVSQVLSHCAQRLPASPVKLGLPSTMEASPPHVLATTQLAKQARSQADAHAFTEPPPPSSVGTTASSLLMHGLASDHRNSAPALTTDLSANAIEKEMQESDRIWNDSNASPNSVTPKHKVRKVNHEASVAEVSVAQASPAFQETVRVRDSESLRFSHHAQHMEVGEECTRNAHGEVFAAASIRPMGDLFDSGDDIFSKYRVPFRKNMSQCAVSVKPNASTALAISDRGRARDDIIAAADVRLIPNIQVDEKETTTNLALVPTTALRSSTDASVGIGDATPTHSQTDASIGIGDVTPTRYNVSFRKASPNQVAIHTAISANDSGDFAGNNIASAGVGFGKLHLDNVRKKLVTVQTAQYTANGTVWLRAWVATTPVSETSRNKYNKTVTKVSFYVCSEDGSKARVSLLNADAAKVCEAAALHADILIGPLKTKEVDVKYSVTGIEYESWGGCNVVLAEPLLGQNEAERPALPDVISPAALAESIVNAEVSFTGAIASVEDPTGEDKHKKRQVIILCSECTEATAKNAEQIYFKVKFTLWGNFVESISPSHVSCSVLLRNTKVHVYHGYGCLSAQAISIISVSDSEPWFHVSLLDYAVEIESWNTYKVKAEQTTTLQQIEKNNNDGAYWALVVMKKLQYDNYVACRSCNKRLHETNCEEHFFCNSCDENRCSGRERELLELLMQLTTHLG